MDATNSSRQTPAVAPNCLKCTFFAVSWDVKFPRSCKVFGIKSKQLPSHAVFKATGTHCPEFKISDRIKENR